MPKRPDFIIIGASRSGTSSLSDWLNRHPDAHVANGAGGEVHFFDLNYHKGNAWYFGHFRDNKVSGEKSPFYLPCPFVPDRIKATCPNTKLIALLREPGSRAYSHYAFNALRGEDNLPFALAVRREEARLSGVRHDHPVWRRFSYLARGRYAEQLEHWKGWRRGRLLLIRSEDLFTDPAMTLASVCQFLDLPTRPGQVLGKVRPQRYAPMGKRVREWLDDYFTPHNERLEREWGISW